MRFHNGPSFCMQRLLWKLRRDVFCIRLSWSLFLQSSDMHMRFPWSLFLQSSDFLENSQGTCFACVCQWSLFLQSSDMHMRFPWSLFLQSSDLLENSQGTCFACVCQWSLFLQRSDLIQNAEETCFACFNGTDRVQRSLLIFARAPKVHKILKSQHQVGYRIVWPYGNILGLPSHGTFAHKDHS